MSRYLLCSVLITVFISIGLSGCADIPASDFYEVDGLISGALDDSTLAPGWKPIYYINSTGLAFSPVDFANESPLSFSVYISNPGNYSFWLLASAGDVSDSLNIQVTDSERMLLSQATAELTDDSLLQWVRAGTETNTDFIRFNEPGQFYFSIRPRTPGNVQIHKFQMSRENAEQPFGLGLPSSIRTDLSAADLFREIPIMLPPAWVFNPIIGFENNKKYLPGRIADTTGQLYEAGGVWTESDSEVGLNDASEETGVRGIQLNLNDDCASYDGSAFSSGYSFIVVEGSPGLDCLDRLHHLYQQNYGSDHRSVLFHGINDAYNPDSKRYPAPMTPGYTFQWTAEATTSNGRFQPGGYKELVNDVSNPAGSIYNMPFLSLPVVFQSGSRTNSSWDSELFIRAIQLSPFLPVMHLIFSGSNGDESGFLDQLNQLEEELLFDALKLRTSLFPYHYTHAHYTRQTNESVISGFRQYPHQFMYGDAFLVAPVIYPDEEGRIVYFPDGRQWYNYYSGQAYEAGRSWFVETRLDQLPLFVKAGSVIPYHVKDSSDHMKIEIYTGDAGALRLVEDDGVTRAYRRTEAARTMFRYNEVEGMLKLTIGAVQAGFEGMSDQRSYDLHFKFVGSPESVEINGEALNQMASEALGNSWRFNEIEREVIIELNNVSRHEKLDIVIQP
jgi:hypothetical protein